MQTSVVLVLVAIVFANVVAAQTGFIDAGSSGSKAYLTGKDAFKYEPGISALKDKDLTAGVTFKGTSTKVSGDNARRDYMRYILDNFYGDNDIEVTLQATAGMRIITKTENAEIYAGTTGKPGVCGVAREGKPKVKIAPLGKNCGTIPGTVEALFEWMRAFDQDPDKSADIGILSSGGASAQIAFPVTTDQLKAFKKFRDDLEKKMPDLKDAEFPPIFHGIGSGSSDERKATKNYLNDFISWVPASELPKAVKDKFASKYDALAVISFLSISDGSLRSKFKIPEDMFKAGGVNEVTKLVASSCVGGESFDFQKCRKAFVDLFHGDLFYREVANYFRGAGIGVKFYTITGAVGPAQAALEDVRPAIDSSKTIYVAGNDAPKTYKSSTVADESPAVTVVSGTLDTLNPKACLTSNAGDARACYDALAKWLAMRCTDAKLKAKPFGWGGKVTFGECPKAFFVEAYYFSFFSTHAIQWPTTASSTTNELAAKTVPDLALKTDYAASATGDATGLNNVIVHKGLDWADGAVYYFANVGGSATALLPASSGGFLEETSTARKLRSILVNNKN